MFKKIMVLGGTGNISVPIVNLLLSKGHQVWCFNRGQNGVVLPSDVNVIIGDRRNYASFESVMQQHSFDVVIDMITFNAEDARSAIKAFPNVAQYIFCSTVCVVGTQSDCLPMDESHTLRPITDYGKNKALAEAVFMQEYYKRKFPVTIIRPSTTYGRQPYLIRQISCESAWVDRIKKGKPILICGNAMELHQFMHVEDAAVGFVGAVAQEQCIGQTYNLVRDETFTWKQYHQAAMQVLGKEVELVSAPYSLLSKSNISGFSIYDEIFAHHSFYCNAKIKRDIPMFVPKIDLHQGLIKTFEYMDNKKIIPNSDATRLEDEIIARVKRL